MEKINLSYVITTRNKITYLREVIRCLVNNIQADEEVVVIDGGSTDGTVDFLQDLYTNGIIHKFLSEPDRGEAHGYNKGIMLAQGELIKLLTDDDVFFFEGIKKCKDFMLNNQDIDVLGTEGAGASWLTEEIYGCSSYKSDYLRWKKTKMCFSFCGLGLMIRRSAVPYIGLFNTGFIRVDAEYTLRITSLAKLKLAWYTGFCWVRMENPQSNSVVFIKKMNEEQNKLDSFYQEKSIMKDKSFVCFSLRTKLRIALHKILDLIYRKKSAVKVNSTNIENANTEWDQKYKDTEVWLSDMNRKNTEILF